MTSGILCNKCNKFTKIFVPILFKEDFHFCKICFDKAISYDKLELVPIHKINSQQDIKKLIMEATSGTTPF